MRQFSLQLDPAIPDICLEAYLQNEAGRSELRPAIIVCPGGSYQHLAAHEGEPVALQFLAAGWQAFVLRYHVGLSKETMAPNQLLTLGKAVLRLKREAAAWGLDPERISIAGFSAGGHLCALYATCWHHEWLAACLGATPAALRPQAAVLCYAPTDLNLLLQLAARIPGAEAEIQLFSQTLSGSAVPDPEFMRQYSPVTWIDRQTVPCFIWHTAADQVVPASGAMAMAEGLARYGVPYELHIYPYGRHGLGLAREQEWGEASVWQQHQSAAKNARWVKDALSFMSDLARD
ncbi:MAG: alpha/beta hydrolase [Oscillospiraceae bacterium]|nr:alpha/beta hydrolase [Oscillospiraceae bacterium]MDD4367572.1 alpha/beta hydrolase [Oscillospiraceae bacterium]